MDVSGVDLTVAATILPLIAAAINRPRWSPEVKGIVAILVCLLYAAAATWFRREWTPGDFRDTAVTVSLAAVVAYGRFWKPTGLGPLVEVKTTPTPRPVRGPGPIAE